MDPDPDSDFQNIDFLIQRYFCGKIFMQVRSVVIHAEHVVHSAWILF